MFGVDEEKLEEFAKELQKKGIQNAFEKMIREKYALRFQNVEVALDKRNDEYIDGEISEWFEFFMEGYLMGMEPEKKIDYGLND